VKKITNIISSKKTTTLSQAEINQYYLKPNVNNTISSVMWQTMRLFYCK